MTHSARRLIGGDDVETCVSHDVLGRLMLMSAREPGLASVYGEVLGFEGDEFYLQARVSAVVTTTTTTTTRRDTHVCVGFRHVRVVCRDTRRIVVLCRALLLCDERA